MPTKIIREGQEQRRSAHPVGDGGTITHLVDGVDEDLGIPPSETVGHIRRLLAQEYRLDDRGLFIPGEGAAYQLL